MPFDHHLNSIVRPCSKWSCCVVLIGAGEEEINYSGFGEEKCRIETLTAAVGPTHSDANVLTPNKDRKDRIGNRRTIQSAVHVFIY